MHEICYTDIQRIKIKDRVHHHLARPVIGDITTPAYLMKGRTD